MFITILSGEEMLDNWSAISPLLKQAVDHNQGESTLADYTKKVLDEKAQCWVIYEDNKITGVGLTEVLVYKQHKSFHIILFAGIDFEKQSKVFPIVEAFAKDCGCSAIEQWGRKGWAKVLPKYVPGFKEVYTVMRKEL